MHGSRAQLSSARAEMGEGSELHESVLRAVLYAVMELAKNVDGSEVMAHVTLNIPNYYNCAYCDGLPGDEDHHSRDVQGFSADRCESFAGSLAERLNCQSGWSRYELCFSYRVGRQPSLFARTSRFI
jgi:hypothetical protein